MSVLQTSSAHQAPEGDLLGCCTGTTEDWLQR